MLCGVPFPLFPYLGLLLFLSAAITLFLIADGGKDEDLTTSSAPDSNLQWLWPVFHCTAPFVTVAGVIVYLYCIGQLDCYVFNDSRPKRYLEEEVGKGQESSKSPEVVEV